MAAQKSLDGKTAIVTGGANGLGKAYVEALVEAGAHVVIGDLNVQDGENLASSLPNTKFVECDVTSWASQLHLFSSAASFSPTGRIHYIIANAGVALADSIFSPDLVEPSLKTIEVDLHGVLYTAKIAMHYFVKQNGVEPSPEQEDTCLILIGSGAAFLDVPRSVQYCAAKWAMRGMMHSLRRTAFYYGSRVNMISPWYVDTKILSPETIKYVQSCGVELASASDAGRALLHILQNREVNGRAFFIAPRKWAAEGFVDFGLDELPEDNALLQEIQKMQMASAPPEAGLFPSGPGVNTK